MKLSEIKGEKAIEVFADLLEPVAEILADKAVTSKIEADAPKIDIIKAILKGHAPAVIEIMAVLDEKDPKEYSVDITTLPMKLIEIFNDEAFTNLFTSQAQDGE